jgi:UPF0271 protein
MNNKIDLNCDMGESFGAYSIGRDEEILPYITSANIACGYHAGDPTVIANTITLALKYNVEIGAHPSYPDLQGFGRRLMKMTPKEIYHMVMYQIAAVSGMTAALGGRLQHVKPHGALYNVAASDPLIAEAIVEAVYHVAPDAILFGLANSQLIHIAEKQGLQVAHEVFADRTYQSDGSLTPRTSPNAIIHDHLVAIEQVSHMINVGEGISVDGVRFPIKAETICIHGDHPSSLLFVKKVREEFARTNIKIEAIRSWVI